MKTQDSSKCDVFAVFEHKLRGVEGDLHRGHARHPQRGEAEDGPRLRLHRGAGVVRGEGGPDPAAV